MIGSRGRWLFALLGACAAATTGLLLCQAAEEEAWPAEWQQRLEAARHLRAQGYEQKAETAYEELAGQARADRSDIAYAAMLELAQWQERRQRFAPAGRSYEQAAGIAREAGLAEPEAGAVFGRARCLAYRGRSAAGAEVSAELLQSHPKEAAELAQVGQFAAAEKLADEGKAEEAAKAYGGIVAEPTRDDLAAMCLWGAATCYAKLGLAERQYKAYEEMIARFPAEDITHWAYTELARHCTDQGQRERALELYRQEKASGDGHESRASYEIAGACGDPQAAIQECEGLIAAYPGSQEAPWATTLMAKSYLRLGQPERAVAVWEKAAATAEFPGRQEVELELATYYRFEEKLPEKALPLYQRVADGVAERRRAPNARLTAHVRGLELTARLEAARILRESGRPDEAIERFTLCTKELGGLFDSWQATSELAGMLRDSGQRDKAADVCRAFLAQDPSAKEYPDSKAKIERLLGDITEGR
jgi:tetratricopeptide (TPR) repeat protein